MDDNIQGVFCKDEIENVKLQNKKGIVVNLQNRNDGSGTHWVCVYKSGNTVEYMDSFGLPPPDVIVKMMKRNGSDVLYSTWQSQNPHSSLCGFYCVNYIKCRSDGMSMYDTIHKFEHGDENKKNINILKNEAV